jgi:hypothetical protein
MQLVAYGAQDIYLTGNPQITFFKVVYRRHTNFAMESVAQTMNGSSELGGKAVATISRNGDLVGRMYVAASLEAASSGNSLVANPGNVLLKEVTCEIGGQQIDKHYGHWLETWAELTEPNPDGVNTAVVVGNAAGTPYQRMAAAGGVKAAAFGDDAGLVHVPLQFWFNRNPGLALPLIALQYHEVKISIQFATLAEMGGTGAAATNIELWADYIYLDTDERRRFAQVSHEYLIEQLQYQNYTDSASLDLTFNHPVKELIWTGVPVAAHGTHTYKGIATPSELEDGNWRLVLNGHDRFAARNTKYFTRTQVWQHHTGHGGVTVPDSIAVYSFALKPEEHQPSGTCNFSRIDNAQLKGPNSGSNESTNVYAVNYNVLRVMSGMGGLAYSN